MHTIKRGLALGTILYIGGCSIAPPPSNVDEFAGLVNIGASRSEVLTIARKLEIPLSAEYRPRKATVESDRLSPRIIELDSDSVSNINIERLEKFCTKKKFCRPENLLTGTLDPDSVEFDKLQEEIYFIDLTMRGIKYYVSVIYDERERVVGVVNYSSGI